MMLIKEGRKRVVIQCNSGGGVYIGMEWAIETPQRLVQKVHNAGGCGYPSTITPSRNKSVPGFNLNTNAQKIE